MPQRDLFGTAPSQLPQPFPHFFSCSPQWRGLDEQADIEDALYAAAVVNGLVADHSESPALGHDP
jgi:hypothetical protein